MDFTPRERISQTSEMIIIFVAILFWVASFIPFINLASVPAGWMTMWFFFKINGGGLIKKPGSEGFTTSLISRIASFLVGFVPVVGALLSAFPLIMYRNIKRIQKEDADFNANMLQ